MDSPLHAALAAFRGISRLLLLDDLSLAQLLRRLGEGKLWYAKDLMGRNWLVFGALFASFFVICLIVFFILRIILFILSLISFFVVISYEFWGSNCGLLLVILTFRLKFVQGLLSLIDESVVEDLCELLHFDKIDWVVIVRVNLPKYIVNVIIIDRRFDMEHFEETCQEVSQLSSINRVIFIAVKFDE